MSFASSRFLEFWGDPTSVAVLDDRVQLELNRGMSSAPPESESALHEAQLAADAALVRQIATGDRSAFAQLYDRYSRPLYATAFRILSDASEAEDIVHDVFVALWSKAKDFDSNRGTAFSWAITLTRNRAIDRVRSRKRRIELLDQSAPSDLSYATGTDQTDLGDELWYKEKAAAVRVAVGELAADQRSALELAFFSGLTQQEIAAKLQEPLGTVKARIRRGLLKLRDRLAHRL